MTAVPPALARLFQLRGFAWTDEAPLTPEGITPVLSDSGTEIGFIDTANAAQPSDDDFSLFDTIIPLSNDARRKALSDLSDTETIALVNVLGDLSAEQRERILDELDTDDPAIETAVENRGRTVGLLSRKSRTTLLAAVRESIELSDLPTEARDAFARSLGEIARLRSVVFRDSLRLAAVVTRKYRGPLDWTTAFLAACRGLEVTLDRYDPALGNELSTYATYWVRHKVLRARQNRAEALRLPAHVLAALVGYRKAEMDLWTEGVRPSVATVVRALEDRGPAAQRAIAFAGPVREAAIDNGTTSDPALAELIEDPGIPTMWNGGAPAGWPERAAEQVIEALESVADGNKFRDRMRMIVRRRLAFDSEHATLDELGTELGISRERVRQLQSRAFGTLKLDHNTGDDIRPWRWRHWK